MLGQILLSVLSVKQLTSPKVNNFEDGEKPKLLLVVTKINLLHGRRAFQSMHLRFVKVKIL